jgi:hypothetical protein
LFNGKKELNSAQQTLSSDPKQLKRWESQQPIDKYNIEGPLKEFYATGSEKLAAKLVGASQEWLDKLVFDDLLEQNSRVSLGVAPHNQAVLLIPTINLLDTALAVKSLSPENRKKLLAKLAFLAYVVNSDDYWSPERGFEANPNMTTTVAHYQVVLASLISSHPMAEQWAQKGLDTLAMQLDEWSDQEGGWLEAPHYALVAYDHMLAAFLAARRAGFSDFLFDDRMKKVIEWLAKISTPPDSQTEGFRHLPPIGNTYFGESTAMFCLVAGIWQHQEPRFAAQMQWMCEQHGTDKLGLGWSFPSLTGYRSMLYADRLEPEKPDYGSTWFSATGVVLRNGLHENRESWLHLIAGQNHEHYDEDSGSIILWGKGSVLANDWGYVGRHDETFHSQLSSSVSIFGTMRVEDFSTQDIFDYVSGRKGSWQRQIAFVKSRDPMQSQFFLLRDTQHFGVSATWRLWLTVDPDHSEPVQFHENRVTVLGIDDVDFDLFFYQPEKLELLTETTSQDIRVASKNGKVGPIKLVQTALIATLNGRGAVTVLIYPRLKTQKPPAVNWYADGRIAKVLSEAGTDVVFVSTTTSNDRRLKHQSEDKSLVFVGSAALVRMRDQQQLLSLGAAGRIQLGKEVLQSDLATTKMLSR